MDTVVTENSSNRDKELVKKHLIAMLKDALREELVALKKKKQILEELEEIDL